MDLDRVKQEHARLSVWAHIATVTPNGDPHVVPVHPCWEGDTLWTLTGRDSVKVRNIAANPRVMLHWQVADQTGFDSLMLWGTAGVHDDLETKTRLWEGVFDYDLSMFAPGGPHDSPETVFLAVEPHRALLLETFGARGREVWTR
jgi:general stress protein 26